MYACFVENAWKMGILEERWVEIRFNFLFSARRKCVNRKWIGEELIPSVVPDRFISYSASFLENFYIITVK